MNDGLPALRKELEQLEAEIEDLEGRLPAHSVKPAMIQELEELEDRYHAIKARITALEQGTRDG